MAGSLGLVLNSEDNPPSTRAILAEDFGCEKR